MYKAYFRAHFKALGEALVYAQDTEPFNDRVRDDGWVRWLSSDVEGPCEVHWEPLRVGLRLAGHLIQPKAFFGKHFCILKSESRLTSTDYYVYQWHGAEEQPPPEEDIWI